MTIRENLDELLKLSKEDVLNHRKQKFLSMGRKKGFKIGTDNLGKMTVDENIFSTLQNKFTNFRIFVYIAIISLLGLIFIMLY